MKKLWLILAISGFPFVANAQETMGGTNYLTNEMQAWPTSETTGYWMVESQGVSIFNDSTIPPRPMTCRGSGYWDETGSWGEGICHEGDDENYIVSSWKEAGDEGTWEILSAAGTYSGASGKGTYTSSDGPHGMRISVWKGEGAEGR